MDPQLRGAAKPRLYALFLPFDTTGLHTVWVVLLESSLCLERRAARAQLCEDAKQMYTYLRHIACGYPWGTVFDTGKPLDRKTGFRDA